MAKKEALPEEEVDKMFEDNKVFFPSRKRNEEKDKDSDATTSHTEAMASESEATDMVTEDHEESNDTPEVEKVVDEQPEIITPEDDGGNEGDDAESKPVIDITTLATIIKAVNHSQGEGVSLSVRYSVQERELIGDFMDKHKKRLKKKINFDDISKSKLMRSAIYYMIYNHEEEFVKAIEEGFKKDIKLPI